MNIRLNPVRFGGIALAGLLFLPLQGNGQETTFQLDMSGDQEVPGPGDEDGQASGTLTIDDATGTVSWDITYSNIASPAAMHIHSGAAGEGGGVVVPLNVETSGGEGTLVGSTTADADAIATVLASPSDHYVNIHNAEFGPGAVRGQLESQ